ncbi:MAG: DUF5780 domain-containing protein [Defluviitaleaceae bacterium]|nr:DUF5780 domain-containing protein [Defluviitaleaceae bacterium]
MKKFIIGLGAITFLSGFGTLNNDENYISNLQVQIKEMQTQIRELQEKFEKLLNKPENITQNIQNVLEISNDNNITNSTEQYSDNLTIEELKYILSQQPVTISSEIIQNIFNNNAIHTLKNNSEFDILHVDMVHAAWDSNGLPIGDLTGAGTPMISWSNINYFPSYASISMFDSFLSPSGFNHINLASGGTYKNMIMTTFSLSNRINSIESIVASFETIDGYIWTNPYFEIWRDLFDRQRRG